MEVETNTSTPPTNRRLQFSLFSLFALTTTACLVLGWWAWPRPVTVVSQIMATSTPIRTLPLVGGTAPRVVDYQSELLAALADPQLLKDAVAITGNGKLTMFRRSDPVAWIQKRLIVDTPGSAIIEIRFTVPEYFKPEAIEFVDYITLRAYTDVNISIGRRTRAWTQRLIRERDALQAEFDATIQQRNELKKSPAPNSQELATLDLELAAQHKSLAELEKDIDFSRTADDPSNNLRLVQNASVLNNWP